MRFLILGAGGIGGYFGGRLVEAGQDATFLLRERRAEHVARDGLTIRSPRGDAHLPHPQVLQADEIDTVFDVVLLSCKAYDLDSAMDAIAPAVGPQTVIVPLLNGMSHLERLDAHFGAGKVIGGYCICSTTLGSDGEIIHFNDAHRLVFGERDGSRSGRVEAIKRAFAPCNFDGEASSSILADMWEKWVFIASAAGITCLMRAGIGDIVEAGGAPIAAALFDECAAIAASQGFALDAKRMERKKTLTEEGSGLMASMLRDIERGGRTEGEHIFGEMLRRAGNPHAAPWLGAAHLHVKAYEARRARETAA